MTERKDITSDTTFLFKEELKMRRRLMKPHIRKMTKHPRTGSVWLYPHAQERRYQTWLFNLMDIYSDIALPALRNNGSRWIE
ncbi:MAG: hypothetical protein ACYTBJ_26935, partial [Planctomycetota bacterium]